MTDKLREALAKFEEAYRADDPEAHWAGDELAKAVRKHVLGGDVPDAAPPVLVGGYQVMAAYPLTMTYGSVVKKWLVVIRTWFDPVGMHWHTVGTARFYEAGQEWLLDLDHERIVGVRWDEARLWFASRALRDVQKGQALMSTPGHHSPTGRTPGKPRNQSFTQARDDLIEAVIEGHGVSPVMKPSGRFEVREATGEIACQGGSDACPNGHCILCAEFECRCPRFLVWDKFLQRAHYDTPGYSKAYLDEHDVGVVLGDMIKEAAKGEL